MASKEQLTAVENGFNAFAKANKLFHEAVAAYDNSGVDPWFGPNMQDRLALIAEGKSIAGYRHLPGGDAVIEAFKANNAAGKNFLTAREAINSDPGNTDAIIAQVDALSLQGKLATAATVFLTASDDGKLHAYSDALAQAYASAGEPTVKKNLAQAMPTRAEMAKEAYAQAEAELRKATAPFADHFTLTDEEAKTLQSAEKMFRTARAATLRVSGQPAETQAQQDAHVAWLRTDAFKVAKAEMAAAQTAQALPQKEVNSIPQAAANKDEHIIVRDETLVGIAKKLIADEKLPPAPDGVDAQSYALAMALIIAKKNNIEDFNKIQADKKLTIPSADEVKNGLGVMQAEKGILNDGHISWSKEIKGHTTSELVGDLATPATPQKPAGEAKGK